jgi:tetratricopeptide (TPR) repeat protein
VSVALSQPASAAGLSAGVSAPRWEPYTSGPVTVQQLRHRVPAKAKDETEKGDKAFQHARLDDAIRHYKLAIAVDPSLVEAGNNLAVCLMQSDLPAAVDQLEQTVELDPHHPVLYRNLTLAYAFSSRFGDAERVGRTAMDLDRTGDQTARFLPGWVLVSEHKYTSETLELLHGASNTIPVAHLLAGVANERLSAVLRLAAPQQGAEPPTLR